MQAALEQFLYRIFRFNPAVVILELRTRLRGQRPYGVLFFYAFIASAAMVITFLVLGEHSTIRGGPTTTEGHAALVVMAMVQLTLVLLIMPAYSAGTIALEREKKTLELMQTSMLSPTDVVSGKLLTIMAFAVMLLLAGLPVAAWSLMLGGVSPSQVLLVYSYLLAVALEVTALGLALSAMSERAVTSVVVTYGVLFFLLGGMPTIIMSLLEALLTPGLSSLLGVGGATVLLLIAAVVLAGLLYMVLRGVVHRKPALAGTVLGMAIPAAVAVGAGLLIVAVGANALSTIASWHPGMLMLLHPYVGLASMLEPDVASGLASGVSSSFTMTPFIVWLLNTGIAVIFATFLWFLAISMYRLKSKRG